MHHQRGICGALAENARPAKETATKGVVLTKNEIPGHSAAGERAFQN
jgi:hypothetical protein